MNNKSLTFIIIATCFLMLTLANNVESIVCYSCAGCSNPASNLTDSPTNCSSSLNSVSFNFFSIKILFYYLK